MYVLIQTKSGNNYIIGPKTGTGTGIAKNIAAFVELIDEYVTTLISSASFNKVIEGDLWKSMSQSISSNLDPEQNDNEKFADLTDKLIRLVNALCTKESYKIKNLWCAEDLSQKYPRSGI